MEDALFLSKFAKKVDIVHRRDDFRASQIMFERAREADNIELITPYVVDRFEGVPGLERAVLKHVETGEEKPLAISGAFIAIGHRPNSEIVEGQVATDQEGYV